VRDVFDLSASASANAPSGSILFAVQSENEHETTSLVQVSSRRVRVEFDFSTSANLIAPSLPILFPVLSENETKQQLCYCRDRGKRELNLT
jgi:hypothetical protein